jgi:hypothetical protein
MGRKAKKIRAPVKAQRAIRQIVATAGEGYDRPDLPFL